MRQPGTRYNYTMPVFDEKQEELEHYETMMGVPRGRLAVTMDMITDAMALVGQHGVYCQSQRWPGKPVLDIQIVMKSLTDAKILIQSVMAELSKPIVRRAADHLLASLSENYPLCSEGHDFGLPARRSRKSAAALLQTTSMPSLF